MEDVPSSRRPGIGETMEMKLRVIGCSPAWPNPGARSRVTSSRGRGPRAPRLRSRGAREAPRAGGLAAHRRDLPHPLPPRPLGRRRPVGLGLWFGPAAEQPRPDLWVPPGGELLLSEIGQRLGTRTCSTRPSRSRSTTRARTSKQGGSRSRRAGSSTTTSGPTASGSRATGRTMAYSGDSGSAMSWRSSRATPTSSSARRHCSSRTPRADARTPRSRRGEGGVQAAGAKRLLLTHRPKERPLDPEFEQVHDGFETEI